MILRAASLVVSGGTLLLCLSQGFWAIVFSLITFVVLCFTSAKMAHTKQYFLNEYGAKGENLGVGVVGKEIAQVVVAVIMAVILLLF